MNNKQPSNPARQAAELEFVKREYAHKWPIEWVHFDYPRGGYSLGPTIAFKYNGEQLVEWREFPKLTDAVRWSMLGDLFDMCFTCKHKRDNCDKMMICAQTITSATGWRIKMICPGIAFDTGERELLHLTSSQVIALAHAIGVP